MASLQAAYDGGNTIALTASVGQIELSNSAEVLGALLSLVATGNAIGVQVNQAEETPAFRADMQSAAVAAAALHVAADTLNQVMVRLVSNIDGFESVMTGLGFALAVGADGTTRVVVRTGDFVPGTSPPLVIATGVALDGASQGALEVGFAATAAAATTDGGFLLEPATGRVRLRRHNIATEGAPVERGLLQLQSQNTAESDATTPEDGDLWLRTEDAAPVRAKGFNAYRAGALGLVARVYQRTFEDADLVAGVLTTLHNLDCLGLVVAVYDDGGLLVQPTLAGGPSYTVAESNENENAVSLNPALLPITGTWRLTLVGV